VVTWRVSASGGFETAWIDFGDSTLAARGRAVGTSPAPYWLEYELETGEDYVTKTLHVAVESEAGRRRLELQRDDDLWTVDGKPLPELADALDCDLGLCPVTNTMPILRHRIHTTEGRHEFLMAWVAVPDLVVTPSVQVYTHLDVTPTGARVRYASGDFTSDLLVDNDGLVVEYPQLATRISGGRL
jgi:hypothetical protein